MVLVSQHQSFCAACSGFWWVLSLSGQFSAHRVCSQSVSGRSDSLFWDSPHIDLFASRANRKFAVYASLHPEPEEEVCEALHASWQGMLAYAFPPLSLLLQVLLKVSQEECERILIAPLWPSRPWSPSAFAVGEQQFLEGWFPLAVNPSSLHLHA